ncbi:serine protease [Massilia sp.]|uniref:trypsin-like serine peptidase n=1 Tax=Massilia sp. TaxID=1882437 RepID=UPI0028974E73|nr:serine protease [Massilia sp.]
MVSTSCSSRYLTRYLTYSLGRIALLFGLLLSLLVAGAGNPAWGQPAPALRAVVPANAAPEAMTSMFSPLAAGEKRIAIPGASWLQLQFSDVQLGPKGVLTITGANGQSQSFTQTQIDSWGGLSATFNGAELRVTLKGTAGAAQISANVKEIIIGLPASAASATTNAAAAETALPRGLRQLLGPDIRRFIPDDLRELRIQGLLQQLEGGQESICGTTDDRVASSNVRVGRIMPIGCTGWLITGGRLVTAGHCISSATQTVQFRVPASRADGTPVAPAVRDQYRVVAATINSQNGGVGNDWAVFEVLPNTETGLMPAAAQGATFQLSNSDNPQQVRITGHGVDGPAPNFGAGGPRNAQNQTQQTHVRSLTQNTGGPSNGVLRYDVDTQGGNSGSPVIVEGTNTAIGIHTNGGCSAAGGTNAGTSFRNVTTWNAVSAGGSGKVWRSTGQACSGNSCPGWQLYDNNVATVRIAAGGTQLYQLHSNGRIWRSTGTPCSGSSCPGWQMLDNNPNTIAIETDGAQLYQLHNNRRIWRYTGVPCSGASCPGWQLLDNNPATVAIVADGGQLYQLHNNGRIWRHTGVPCSGVSCPGWQLLDNNGATVAISAGGGRLYQLHSTGRVWLFTGTPCSGSSCPGWQMFDNNPATVAIAAGTRLYQMHGNGRIWRSTGAPCTGASCPGWQMLDNNPATIAIYADGGDLYQLHNSGRVWRSTGATCSGASCPGWQMHDNNPATGRLAAGAAGRLYQLHTTRTPMTRARICYECK